MVLLETECTVARLCTVGDAAVDPEEHLRRAFHTDTFMLEKPVLDGRSAVVHTLSGVRALTPDEGEFRTTTFNAHVVASVAAYDEALTL